MNCTYPSERIIGNRVELKKHTIEMAEVAFNYIHKDRKRLKIYLPWASHINSVEDEKNYILSTLESWNNYKSFDYGIWTHDSLYLGNIGAHFVNWKHHWCEFSYWLLSECQGRGYMTEALNLISAEFFRLGFHRLVVCCDPTNEKSASVAKRCGYTLEGLCRDCIAWEDGTYKSSLTFSKLSRD